MTNGFYEVVSPLGEVVDKGKRGLAPRLATLEGKTVCEICHASFGGDITFPVFEKMLRERYPSVKVIPYTEFPLTDSSSLKSTKKAQTLEALRVALVERRCDAVISGNGG